MWRRCSNLHTVKYRTRPNVFCVVSNTLWPLYFVRLWPSPLRFYFASCEKTAVASLTASKMHWTQCSSSCTIHMYPYDIHRLLNYIVPFMPPTISPLVSVKVKGCGSWWLCVAVYLLIVVVVLLGRCLKSDSTKYAAGREKAFWTLVSTNSLTTGYIWRVTKYCIVLYFIADIVSADIVSVNVILLGFAWSTVKPVLDDHLSVPKLVVAENGWFFKGGLLIYLVNQLITDLQQCNYSVTINVVVKLYLNNNHHHLQSSVGQQPFDWSLIVFKHQTWNVSAVSHE